MREELHRIDRLIAEPHFKVQVRARNPPGPAEIADILALLDLLAFPDSEFVQMGITQGDAFSGIDVDGQAIGAFAAAVLQRADEAREMLRDYAVMLPQEQNPETGTEALVSPELRPIAMRGLLDPALRDSTWPRDMAWLVIGGMEHASYANGNRVMVLDVTATATVAGLLEEAFR